MTINDIINWVNRNPIPNVAILRGMIETVQVGDNVDLSHITATASDILAGKQSINTLGEAVDGTCDYNATVPSIAENTTWIAQATLAEGVSALILVDGVWTLITGEAAE